MMAIGMIRYSGQRLWRRRPCVRIALSLSACLLCLSAQAAPVDVASLDRGTWPEQFSTPALFDVASRAEILMFAHSLLASEALDDAALKQRLGLKIINRAAIDDLRRQLWQRLLENYSFAQESCEVDASFCYLVESMDDLREQAGKFEVGDDSFYIGWAARATRFMSAIWTICCARPRCSRRSAAKSRVSASMSAMATNSTTACSS